MKKFEVKILPFDIDWLAEHFNLDKSLVVDDGFDVMGGLHYIIEFCDENAAKSFQKELKKRADLNTSLWGEQSLHIHYNNCLHKILRAVGMHDAKGFAPYNLEFLKKYFQLDPTLVAYTDYGIQFYDICFIQREEAEIFHQKMSALKCYSIWAGGHVSKWGRNQDQYRTVSFNASMTAAIILAVVFDQLPNHKFKKITNPQAIPLLPFFMENPSPCKPSLTKTENNTSLLQEAPFNLLWLVEHFPDILKEEYIKEAKNSSLYPHQFQLIYKDEFKDRAKEFNAFLRLNQIGVNHWDWQNALEFNQHSSSKLLLLGENQQVSNKHFNPKS